MKSTTERDAAHASRVKENKRRHRARQKEYVSDLEQALSQLRKQGVQATIEVQKAAQQIAVENAKLRSLLERLGFNSASINRALESGDSLRDEESRVLEPRQLSSLRKHDTEPTRPAARIATNLSASDQGKVLSSRRESECCAQSQESNGDTKSVVPDIAQGHREPAVLEGPASASATEDGDSFVRAPCKLLSLLSENPAADITQIAVISPQPAESCVAGRPTSDESLGVECGTAYKMLMQYADSDEKVDAIASALEGGCVAGAGGRCSVKNSTIWKVLDEHCL